MSTSTNSAISGLPPAGSLDVARPAPQARPAAPQAPAPQPAATGANPADARRVDTYDVPPEKRPIERVTEMLGAAAHARSAKAAAADAERERRAKSAAAIDAFI